jgi:hypothetical protein
MLTKQWQMGEFKADDAGSPVLAKMHMATTRLTKYSADGNPPQLFTNETPLEAQVERRPIPLFCGEQVISLDIRLLLGRHWLKLLKKELLGHLSGEFIREYGLAPPDPADRADVMVCAHQSAWQKFAAMAGHCVDGGKLLLHLKSHPTHHASDGIASSAAEKVVIEVLEVEFRRWFEELFYQPPDAANEAWLPERLEYQFACSAPEKDAEKVLTAEEYYHGHLDWYNFSIDQTRRTLGPINDPNPVDVRKTITRSFMPNPVAFAGMPQSRWWRFEDGRTNFGDIKPDTTDLNKLILMEFGLVYANDWFMLPVTVPTGSIVSVSGLVITNVFGERFWIEPAGKGSDEDPRRWTMYTMNVAGHADVPADAAMLVAPTIPLTLEGKALEEVYLMRDEVANMVWGVETRIALPNGEPVPGREAGLQLQQHYQRIVQQEGGGTTPPPAVEPSAVMRYLLMKGVPENWIPFIPVHKDNDRREIQLQRASMPRLIEGDMKPIERIKPRTSLLRAGLSATPRAPYFIFEEEVPRAGVRVRQSFQRTRWYGGKVITWLGVQKQAGRGEGASGLAFDQLVPTGAPPAV